MAEANEQHLLNHLRDVHAITMHALRQLERAARRRDEQISTVYEQHLEQSQPHERRIRELVEKHGHEPSPVEDKTLRGRSIGLRQVADIALDTPVKLSMNLFAVEHLEIAAYELLAEIAQRAQDEDTVRAAEEILEEKRAAVEQVEGTFDHAVELLDDSAEDNLLLAHLSDVHALERQSMLLLQLAVNDVCDDEQLKNVYSQHLEQTENHEHLMAERIEAQDGKPSAVKDLHLAAAKSGLQDLADSPPDAEAKMAMNLFCIEHLEIAAHEFLIRIAEQAGDSETADAARKILDEEREAAQKIREGFGRAVELMFESDGSYETVKAAERPSQDDDPESPDEDQESPSSGQPVASSSDEPVASST